MRVYVCVCVYVYVYVCVCVYVCVTRKMSSRTARISTTAGRSAALGCPTN